MTNLLFSWSLQSLHLLRVDYVGVARECTYTVTAITVVNAINNLHSVFKT